MLEWCLKTYNKNAYYLILVFHFESTVPVLPVVSDRGGMARTGGSVRTEEDRRHLPGQQGGRRDGHVGPAGYGGVRSPVRRLP